MIRDKEVMLDLLNWLVVFHLGNKLVDSYLSNEEEEQEIVMNQDTPITSLGGHAAQITSEVGQLI